MKSILAALVFACVLCGTASSGQSRVPAPAQTTCPVSGNHDSHGHSLFWRHAAGHGNDVHGAGVLLMVNGAESSKNAIAFHDSTVNFIF